MRTINYSANYWRADDERVYDSARQNITNEGDPDYVTWIETRGPSPWPPLSFVGTQTKRSLAGSASSI